MTTPEQFKSMHNSWFWLFGRLRIEPPDSYPLLDNLITCYSEPHRHYHDLEHVGEVLKVCGKLAGLATNLDAILLAA